MIAALPSLNAVDYRVPGFLSVSRNVRDSLLLIETGLDVGSV